MSEHRAEVFWRLDGDFAANAYSRAHEIRLDGGITIAASASPAVVPAPHSVAAALDPEEAFVAALSACHMLWFLDHARRAGHVVASYRDRAQGRMVRTPEGTFWIAEVTLAPELRWTGT
ncbi:MAG: OsmC family peroxiredoxin, partial [Pseudomonadota bacterium]